MEGDVFPTEALTCRRFGFLSCGNVVVECMAGRVGVDGMTCNGSITAGTLSISSQFRFKCKAEVDQIVVQGVKSHNRMKYSYPNYPSDLSDVVGQFRVKDFKQISETHRQVVEQ